MSAHSRRKGAAYEREIVHAARDKGMTAERVQGRAGCARKGDPDVLIADRFAVECKRRKSIPSYLESWLDGADMVAMRGDRGDTVVVMTLDRALMLMRWASEGDR